MSALPAMRALKFISIDCSCLVYILVKFNRPLYAFWHMDDFSVSNTTWLIFLIHLCLYSPFFLTIFLFLLHSGDIPDKSEQMKKALLSQTRLAHNHKSWK